MYIVVLMNRPKPSEALQADNGKTGTGVGSGNIVLIYLRLIAIFNEE